VTIIRACSSGTHLFVGDQPQRGRFCRARNPQTMRRLQKPTGGLWTSPLKMIADEQCSPWIRWCREHHFRAGTHRATWILTTTSARSILVIDSASDFANVICEYRDLLSPPLLPTLEFERMYSDGFAGLHLTERGCSASRQPVNGIDFFHWTVSSTIWFDWIFDKISVIGSLTQG